MTLPKSSEASPPSVEASRHLALETLMEEAPGMENAADRATDGRARDRLGGMAIPLVLVLLFALFSVLSPDVFFTTTNMRVLIAGQATAVLLAVAATIPLRSGDFDLSISAVMILSACSVPTMTENGIPLPVACLLGLGIGLCVGLANAFFIVLLDIDGLIVTLGMLTILTGFAGLVSNNQIVTSVPVSLQDFAGREFMGLPIMVWIGWLLAALVWYVFEHTPIGRYMLFIGGNRSAAHLAGVRVNRLRAGSLVASAVISAGAGILLAGSLGAIDPTSGGAYLLPPFTAAFLGASAVQLGRFNIVGTLVGLYLLAVGIAGLQLLGLQGWIADLFNGACLIGAVAFARALRRSSS